MLIVKFLELSIFFIGHNTFLQKDRSSMSKSHKLPAYLTNIPISQIIFPIIPTRKTLEDAYRDFDSPLKFPAPQKLF
jgi:hypothetical protein